MRGDNISTVEGIQYCGGIPSVLWGDNSSTCGGKASVLWGIPSVLWRLFSTVGDASVLWRVFSTFGDNISTCRGITSVLWRVFSTVGVSFSTVGDNISTVEVAQYSGDKDLKYYEFSKNLKIFSRAYFASKSDRPHHRTQLLTTADMVKDPGNKNLVLGKILL